MVFKTAQSDIVTINKLELPERKGLTSVAPMNNATGRRRAAYRPARANGEDCVEENEHGQGYDPQLTRVKTSEAAVVWPSSASIITKISKT